MSQNRNRDEDFLIPVRPARSIDDFKSVQDISKNNDTCLEFDDPNPTLKTIPYSKKVKARCMSYVDWCQYGYNSLTSVQKISILVMILIIVLILIIF